MFECFRDENKVHISGILNISAQDCHICVFACINIDFKQMTEEEKIWLRIIPKNPRENCFTRNQKS